MEFRWLGGGSIRSVAVGEWRRRCRLTEAGKGEEATSYGWNLLDERTSVSVGAENIAYTYDALGRQATRETGSAIRPTRYGDLDARSRQVLDDQLRGKREAGAAIVFTTHDP